jgi:hypothetical protein
MKKLVLMLAMLVFVSIIGCGSNNTPTETVKKFYEAGLKGDMKTLEAISTQRMFSVATAFKEKMQGAIKKSGKITKISEVIKGDTAIVTVTTKDGEVSKMNLVKVNGKWKVDLEK